MQSRKPCTNNKLSELRQPKVLFKVGTLSYNLSTISMNKRKENIRKKYGTKMSLVHIILKQTGEKGNARISISATRCANVSCWRLWNCALCTSAVHSL